MSFSKKLTEARIERRRRLLEILPEVLEDLKARRACPDLTGKEIKEIDYAALGVRHFLSSLRSKEMIHDCYLSKVVGSAAVGHMYFAATGERHLSFFLESDYHASEDIFKRKAMEVPIVLREIYKKYKRFDIPADDKDADIPGACRASDC